MKYAYLLVALVTLLGAEAFSPRKFILTLCIPSYVTTLSAHLKVFLFSSDSVIQYNRIPQGSKQASPWAQEGSS
jgi:hypothetical protein